MYDDFRFNNVSIHEGQFHQKSLQYCLGPINTRTCYCPFPLIIMLRVLVMRTSLWNLYFAKLYHIKLGLNTFVFSLAS